MTLYCKQKWVSQCAAVILFFCCCCCCCCWCCCCCCFNGGPQPPFVSDRPEVLHYSVQLDASDGKVLFYINTKSTQARIRTLSRDQSHIIKVSAVNILGIGAPAIVTGNVRHYLVMFSLNFFSLHSLIGMQLVRARTALAVSD